MNKKNLKSYNRLPEYLKSFVVEQEYGDYSSRDQATWRFIARNTKDAFKESAFAVYFEGLEKTGIPTDRIPSIEEMDRVLNSFGWGAVCVCGFIPPLAFLDFQAHNILPIAADMRTLEHLAYTPAPDIVHEAAGHAPILIDKEYSKYLRRYANLARKAIFSDEDIKLYEAIRHLSDVKENPDSSVLDCKNAEEELNHAVKGVTWDSEAAKVSRLYWWTAEYGLIGDISSPKIYGAGLLSSLGEGLDCFDDKIKKIPLSLKCIEQSYDITKPQPQLYVAKDFSHALSVLEELEDLLAYKRGGVYALNLGIKSRSLTSAVLDSGLEVTGVLENFEEDQNSNLSFLKWSGPVQLSYKGKQLTGHGKNRHPQGFSMPLGPWEGLKGADPVGLSDENLQEHGISKAKKVKLIFTNGFVLNGRVESWVRCDGKLLLMTWSECTLSKDGQIYFDPAWGEFDLAFGQSVNSVYGGPADWEEYGEYNFGEASSTPKRASPYTPDELDVFAYYEKLREVRSSLVDKKAKGGKHHKILELIDCLTKESYAKHPEEWLIQLEALEIIAKLYPEDWESKKNSMQIKDRVLAVATSSDQSISRFIKRGLDLVGSPD